VGGGVGVGGGMVRAGQAHRLDMNFRCDVLVVWLAFAWLCCFCTRQPTRYCCSMDGEGVSVFSSRL